MAKIASPLFILREHCAKDLYGVLERIALLGFDGVEFLSTFGRDAREVRVRLDALGLTAVGNHVGFNELADETERVLDENSALGCGFITAGGAGADAMPGGKNYRGAIETWQSLCEKTKARGMTLLYHNHAQELKNKINGKTELECLMDDAPSLSLEPDLGWMKIGGADPFYFLEKYAGRCPVIHFKDYMFTEDGFVFRPTGYGSLDCAGLGRAANKCSPVWYVLDHDHAYERDIYGDLKLSLDYFKNLEALG